MRGRLLDEKMVFIREPVILPKRIWCQAEVRWVRGWIMGFRVDLWIC